MSDTQKAPMTQWYAVTFYVQVTDADALINRAHREGLDGDDVEVEDALRYLLDNNDALEGAEIDDSKCEFTGEGP